MAKTKARVEVDMAALKDLISSEPGLISAEIVKRLDLDIPDSPNSGAYRLSRAKRRLGNWVFCQKYSSKMRWFTADYAKENNLEKKVGLPEVDRPKDLEKASTMEAVRLMALFHMLMRATINAR